MIFHLIHFKLTPDFIRFISWWLQFYSWYCQ